MSGVMWFGGLTRVFWAENVEKNIRVSLRVVAEGFWDGEARCDIRWLGGEGKQRTIDSLAAKGRRAVGR